MVADSHRGRAVGAAPVVGAGLRDWMTYRALTCGCKGDRRSSSSRTGRIAQSRWIAALVFMVVVAGCGSRRRCWCRCERDSEKRDVDECAGDHEHAGWLRLVSEAGVTPAELQRAENLIASTIKDLKRFQTPAQAYAAGYRSIGDALTGDDHADRSYVNDGPHPRRAAAPSPLSTNTATGKQTAVAAMYQLPFGSRFTD